MARVLFRLLRKTLVLVIGTAVVLLGILLLVLPGPGWVVIFAGLGVLASEFSWARRLSDRLRALVVAGWRRASRAVGPAR